MATSEPVDVPADVAQPFEVADITLEEATLVASGRLFDQYGPDGDPVALGWQWEATTHNGEAVWELEARVEVTVDGQRVERRWRFWVGADAGQPVVRDLEALDGE